MYSNISQLMDKDQSKFHSRTDSHERKCVVEKEGYVEAPSADVKTSIRQSSLLQNKKMSSCSPDLFRSHNGSKYPIKSSINSSKIREGNKHRIQIQNRNKFNSVFSADTVSVKSSKLVPSFKYQVLAKDGIQLVVDLNMKQSDWLKSMENKICVCRNHMKPEFESFKKEVEYIGNKKNIKASLIEQTTSSVTSLMSREYVKSSPSVVENEVITGIGSDCCWSKVDQNMDLRYENLKVQKNSFNSGSVLNSTAEVNQEAGGNYERSTVENEEQTKSAEVMEVSGGEENVLVTLASKGGPKRRKCYHKSDDIHGQSHERLMRSTKLYGSQIIDSNGVLIRQSPRLYSK